MIIRLKLNLHRALILLTMTKSITFLMIEGSLSLKLKEKTVLHYFEDNKAIVFG